jgi:hypothetical protein
MSTADHLQEVLDLSKTPLDTLALWIEIREFLKQNIELSNELEYEVIIGWIFASWIPEKWNWYSILNFLGPYKSGKTRAQDTVSRLSMNPISTVNMTLSALKHSVKGNNSYHTLFFDEWFLNLKIESNGEMLKILNAGYRKGGCVQDCVQNSNGEWTPKNYPCDGFKCIAGRQPLEDSLRSRSITVRMRKTKQKFPMTIDQKQADVLKTKLEAWRLQNGDKSECYQITNEIETLLFEKTGKDGRLRELFSSVYVVTPAEFQPKILEYLEEIGKLEQQEEAGSYESEIFTAILKVTHDGCWFSTKSATAEFNEGRSESERISSRSIGKKIRELGFKLRRRNSANGWFYDLKLVEKLKERYEIEDEDVQTQQQTLEDNQNHPLPEPEQKES